MQTEKQTEESYLQVTQLPENHNTLHNLLGHLNYQYWKVVILALISHLISKMQK